MVFGLIVFVGLRKHLLGHAESPAPEKLAKPLLGPLKLEHAIYLGALAGVAVVWQLLQRTWTVHGAMHLVSLTLLGWFIWFVVTQCTKVEREQMIALIMLILSCLIFFSLYEQTYGAWLAFTDRLLTRDVLGWQMTPAQSTSIGALFIVALSPVFAWLWPWLDKRNANPSKPLKSVIGLAFGGLAFVPLWLATKSITTASPTASIWWLFLAYFVIELGEMSLSPIGLAAVSQLSVKRVTALMMGTWFLATAYSEVIAAAFGKLTSLDKVEATDVVVAATKYGDLFQAMVWLGLGSAVLYLLLARPMTKWMHGEK